MFKFLGFITIVFTWWRNKKRDIFNQGVASEKAETDAANAELIKEKSDAEQDVDRLTPDAARDELQHWSPKPPKR